MNALQTDNDLDSPLDPGLQESVRKEMHRQLVISSKLSLWTIPVTIVLLFSALKNELPLLLLSSWVAVALIDYVMILLNYRQNRRRDRRQTQTRKFMVRNQIHFLIVGLVWGSLPVLNALWGTDFGLWLSLIVDIATIALLTFMLGTYQTFFLTALIPIGSLMTAGILLSNFSRLEMSLLSVMYCIMMWRLQKLFYSLHMDRIQTSLRNEAQAEALSRTMEFRDSLTRLLNRPGLKNWLLNEQYDNQLDRSVLLTLGSVLGFREINFLYGSTTADQLLIEMARRLESEAKGQLVVSRIGGADFLLADLRANASPELHADLFTLLEHDPVVIGQRMVTIGIQHSHIKGSIDDLDHLITVLQDRLQDRATQLYGEDSEIRQQLDQRRVLLNSFDTALAENEIQSWFQPIVDCKSNRIIGWEALARWVHPEFGMLAPAHFLEIARISRKSSLLTQMMFRSSALFVKDLISKGLHPAAKASINFSITELRNPETLQWAGRILQETGVQAQQIVIEISEKEALVMDEQFALNLYEMKRMGFGISIDDFGTGFANLGQLLDLPASTLKIDKRFVDKLPADRDSAALVKGIVMIASGMGMRTIAEGVESPEQLRFLTENNCDAYQGYLAGVALPPKAALDLAARWANS